MKFSNRITNSPQLLHQPQLLSDLIDTTEHFLQLARSAESESNDEYVPTTTVEQSQTIVSHQLLQPIGQFTMSPITVLPGLLDTSTTIPAPPSFDSIFAATAPSWASPKAATHSGRFSPRLSFGLLGGPASLSGDPIIEYLIGGQRSFATRLYIDTIVMVWKVLRGDIEIPGFIPSICRYRFRYERPDQLIQLIGLQLKRMGIPDANNDTGTEHSESESPGTRLRLFETVQQEALLRIKIKLTTDLELDGESIRDWLDPWGTQQYITSSWGIKLTSKTVQISPKALRSMIQVRSEGLNKYEPHAEILEDSEGFPSLQENFEEIDIKFDAQPLIQMLGLESMCLGEGPRFSRKKIKESVHLFLKEVVGNGYNTDARD